MFLKKTDKEYVKISDLVEKYNLDKRRVYEHLRILENSGKVKFDKTPFGRTLISVKEMFLLIEFERLEGVFENPDDILEIIFNTSTFKKLKMEDNEDDYKWAKGLKNIVWRKF